MKNLLSIPIAIWKNKKLILQLSKNDFKTRFAGSMLGRVWGFSQPVVMVLVYWFAFERGLRMGAARVAGGIEIPYVLWLVAGLVPWFYFSDALSGGTNALIEYSYLVKKVVFEISILPVVKVVSALFTHVFFVVIAVFLYSCYGMLPDLYVLQIVYYSFAMFMLCLGLAYLNSAIVVFFKDWGQVISIVLQVGIWMTPVMWIFDNIDIPEYLKIILELNPMFYIVQGYRDALINKVWFWEHYNLTPYFWIVTILILIVGTTVFRRLRVHFADVL